MANTVTLHRIFTAPVEKVYKAFIDADAMVSWLPPYGFVCKVHSLNAVVGGTYKMSFTNFGAGSSHSFGGEYVEIIPNELLKYTDKFDDHSIKICFVWHRTNCNPRRNTRCNSS
jgi:uncharacterized protein YndB with AHSA1/START domain